MFWRMSLLFVLAEFDRVTGLVDRFNGKTKGLQFLYEHSKGGGDAGLLDRLTLHDRLVGVHTSLNIIRFDRQHFLKGMRGTIGFERPHFHFTEALTAELRLTTERLL